MNLQNSLFIDSGVQVFTLYHLVRIQISYAAPVTQRQYMSLNLKLLKKS